MGTVGKRRRGFKVFSSFVDQRYYLSLPFIERKLEPSLTKMKAYNIIALFCFISGSLVSASSFCEDQYPGCSRWKKEGYCTDEHIYGKAAVKAIKEDCPASCGTCDTLAKIVFGCEDRMYFCSKITDSDCETDEHMKTGCPARCNASWCKPSALIDETMLNEYQNYQTAWR